MCVCAYIYRHVCGKCCSALQILCNLCPLLCANSLILIPVRHSADDYVLYLLLTGNNDSRKGASSQARDSFSVQHALIALRHAGGHSQKSARCSIDYGKSLDSGHLRIITSCSAACQPARAQESLESLFATEFAIWGGYD